MTRPWTKDKILDTYRFTNVFRELDATTQWFRKHVRDPLCDKPEVLLATVVFRMLNRIQTGEAIFTQTDIDYGGRTAFEYWYSDGHYDKKYLRRSIKQVCGNGPYVTGAYIISSPQGYSKLDGMMRVIHGFATEIKPFNYGPASTTSNWRGVAKVCKDNQDTKLQDVFDWLSQFDYFGKFHSYEIVTDLRHTLLLCDAPDIMTWCNVGPGARRGLNRVMGRDKKDKSISTEQMLEEMRVILRESLDPDLWPGKGKHITTARGKSSYSREDWPKWEMRDVEHTLCEFDKYSRVLNGEGRPRGVYR